VLPLVTSTLQKIDPARFVSRPQPFSEIRGDAYKTNRDIATTLLGVCALLVMVIALGILGLTHYWISQRRLLIGIRRALGASRNHIMLRFHAENLVIVAIGVSVGAAGAFLLSQLLAVQFHLPPVAPTALVVGAGIVILVSQLAVWWPARQAAMIPPAVVARNP
jgi:putative ABC transport system permease protein